jgi:hypothetical protein
MEWVLSGLQERGADDAGRVAEGGTEDGRPELVAEDVARDGVAAAVVEGVDAGEAAAEHDGVGVEHVDQVGERAPEGVEVALEDARSPT